MPRQPRGQPVIRMTITLPPDTVDQLRVLADHQGATVAELIRRAATELIARETPTGN